MVIRYTPNGFLYPEVAGRSLPFIAPLHSRPQKAQPPGKLERRASPVARFWTSSASRICGLSPARATGSSSTRDIKAGIYDTRSIYAMPPSDLSFGHWVEEARVFVAYVNTSWK
jgi:hypothetical protein